MFQQADKNYFAPPCFCRLCLNVASKAIKQRQIRYGFLERIYNVSNVLQQC